MKAIFSYTKISIAIAIIAFGLLVIAFIGTLNTPCYQQVNGGVMWIASFISIANGLLLFATLSSQQNSIINAQIERFEVTFFNLLHAHLQYRDEITAVRPYLSSESIAKLEHRELKGKDFFSMAVSDLDHIFENLENNYSRVYKAQNAFERQQDYEWNIVKTDYLNDCPKGKDMREDEAKALINYIYGITKEDIDKHPEESCLDLKIFNRKMMDSYEQYERSLVCILRYISESGLEVEKYIDILCSQMSDDEYRFVHNLTRSNETLLCLMQTTKLASKGNPPNLEKLYNQVKRVQTFEP